MSRSTFLERATHSQHEQRALTTLVRKALIKMIMKLILIKQAKQSISLKNAFEINEAAIQRSLLLANSTTRRLARDLTVKSEVTSILNRSQAMWMMRRECVRVIIAMKQIILQETARNHQESRRSMQLFKTFDQVLRLTFDKRFLRDSSSRLMRSWKTKWTREHCGCYRESKKQSSMFIRKTVCAHWN